MFYSALTIDNRFRPGETKHWRGDSAKKTRTKPRLRTERLKHAMAPTVLVTLPPPDTL